MNHKNCDCFTCCSDAFLLSKWVVLGQNKVECGPFADCHVSGPVRLAFLQLHGTVQSRKDCISTFISERFDTL